MDCLDKRYTLFSCAKTLMYLSQNKFKHSRKIWPDITKWNILQQRNKYKQRNFCGFYLLLAIVLRLKYHMIHARISFKFHNYFSSFLGIQFPDLSSHSSLPHPPVGLPLSRKRTLTRSPFHDFFDIEILTRSSEGSLTFKNLARASQESTGSYGHLSACKLSDVIHVVTGYTY